MHLTRFENTVSSLPGMLLLMALLVGFITSGILLQVVLIITSGTVSILVNSGVDYGTPGSTTMGRDRIRVQGCQENKFLYLTVSAS